MISFKKVSKRPLGIDLFAGAGGLSLGFEQAGFELAAAVEIDPIHCATHEYNFSNCTTICASVVDLSGDKIRSRAGLDGKEIDVVFGGPPCQGFSMIGKRMLDDPRNSLVFHFVRLIEELQPKYCVFENVKGLTFGLHSNFLGEVIEELRRANYQVVSPYQVLNAADFGVPQDRQRLFLMAARKDMKLPTYPIREQDRVTVWEAIGDLPDADAFPTLKEQDWIDTKWNSRSDYSKRLRGLVADPQDFGYPRAFDRDRLSCSLRTIHTKLSSDRFSATAHGETEPVSRFHKLDPKGVSNTLRAGTDSARGAFTSPRPIHPYLARVITVREAARLHSYPDWFSFHATKWHGFRQIGNSVPPHLGRAVAAAVLRELKIRPNKPKSTHPLGDSSLLQFNMSEASVYFGVDRNVIAQRQRKPEARERRQSPRNLELAL
jgi:DNA (cytosine-5)-methyltransferase 1